jgi:hypothetical protein
MKSLNTVIPAFLALVFITTNAQAFDLGVEEAVESDALKISLDEETATGVVYGKMCDQCEQLKLAITPQTRAYAGKTPVGIAQAKSRLGREATVIYNKHTNEVIRIRW